MDKLTDLFSFQGRANRAWYFWHVVLDDLAIFTLAAVFVVLTVVTGSLVFILPAVGAGVAGFWAAVAITVKRLHDLDRPAWHWWLMFVPLYNVYLGLVLVFQRGSWGPNRFGADPLQAAKVDVYLEP